MFALFLILIAFAPGIFWLWFFYKKDKLEPEPKSLILKMFFFGMLIAIPASILELPFMFSNIVLVVIAAPVIEEWLKYLVVKKVIFKDKEFDEPMDGIIYAAAVALGFASLENAGYLLEAFSSGTLVSTFVLRAVLSVPGHVLFSAMWGYTLGMSKFSGGNRVIAQRGLLLAMILHGIFNLLASISALFAIGMLILIPVMWRMVNERIHTALKNHTGEYIEPRI